FFVSWCLCGYQPLDLRSLQCRKHALISEWNATQPDACRIVDRVRDRSHQRLANGLAGSIMRKIRTIWIWITVHDDNVDLFRSIGVRETGVRVPIYAQDLLGIEFDLFIQRAAERVQHAAFDCLSKRSGIDDQSAIVRADEPLHPNVTGISIHLDL